MPQRLPTRSWLLEILLAALAMLLGLFFVANSVSEGDGAPIALEAAAAAVSLTGLVLFRRSHPVALTLFLIPCGILLGMPMGATPVALFAVALHRRARVAIALAALHAAAAAVIYGLVLGLTRAYFESVAFLVLLHVSLVAVAMVIRAHRQLVASWAERVRQAEEGQRLRVEQARHAEREQIAREMHDVLAHRISLLAVHAGALSVQRDASEDERQAAGVIRQCAHDALEDLRSLLGMLRAPAVDHPLPTLDDVPALVEQSRGAGANVSLSLTNTDDPETVPDQIGRHAYRIIQEALTNALKHAPGSPVRVAIDVRHMEGLSVHVVNDLGWHRRPDKSRTDARLDRSSASRSDARPGRSSAASGAARLGRPGASLSGAGLDGPSASRSDARPGRSSAASGAAQLDQPGASVSGAGPDRPGASLSDGRLDRPGVSRGAARLDRPGASLSGARLDRPGASLSGAGLDRPGASLSGARLDRPGVLRGAAQLDQPGAGSGADWVFPGVPRAEPALAGAIPGTGPINGTRVGWAEWGEGSAVEPIPGAGAGLAGLRERVQLVGGRLEHGPTASGEFDVKAWLPWHT
ncbi:histidine kinase [Actinoplanes sp. NPDC026619]|uniref:sensor histidine kinase n=1 Tax=Actinoplanes sp. NPDC026619 TaxID=3155798 RepID=UPI0033FAB8EA